MEIKKAAVIGGGLMGYSARNIDRLKTDGAER